MTFEKYNIQFYNGLDYLNFSAALDYLFESVCPLFDVILCLCLASSLHFEQGCTTYSPLFSSVWPPSMYLTIENDYACALMHQKDSCIRLMQSSACYHFSLQYTDNGCLCKAWKIHGNVFWLLLMSTVNCQRK